MAKERLGFKYYLVCGLASLVIWSAAILAFLVLVYFLLDLKPGPLSFAMKGLVALLGVYVVFFHWLWAYWWGHRFSVFLGLFNPGVSREQVND